MNSDLIVAVSEADWDGGSHCNKVRSTPFLAGFAPLTFSRYHLHSKFKSPTQVMGKFKRRLSATCAQGVPLAALVSLTLHGPSIGSHLPLFSHADMSPSLFENLDGSLDAGVFQMSWKYV